MSICYPTRLKLDEPRHCGSLNSTFYDELIEHGDSEEEATKRAGTGPLFRSHSCRTGWLYPPNPFLWPKSSPKATEAWFMCDWCAHHMHGVFRVFTAGDCNVCQATAAPLVTPDGQFVVFTDRYESVVKDMEPHYIAAEHIHVY